MRALLLLPVGFALLGSLPVRADKGPEKVRIEYIDDDAVMKGFTEKLGALAEKGKCLKPAKLRELTAEDKTAELKSAEPKDKPLSPEDLAASLKASVFVIGSVVEENGDYAGGRMATAWVLAADGILVTNSHVFDEIGDGESFGAANAAGEVFPITGVLARNKAADIAIFRIAAKGLTPLPVSAKPAAVGAWTGVLGHPGDRYYTFTQGHVTRYTKYVDEDGEPTRWMAIDADYASGSSGSPVVDRSGNVVGMAALTESIDGADDGKPAKEVLRKRMVRSRKKADDKPQAVPSTQQMVVKLTVPASEIRKAMGE